MDTRWDCRLGAEVGVGWGCKVKSNNTCRGLKHKCGEREEQDVSVCVCCRACVPLSAVASSRVDVCDADAPPEVDKKRLRRRMRSQTDWTRLKKNNFFLK